MQLLVFAHRAEAQTFIKQGSYKSIDSDLYPTYKNSHSYLIISGEGIFNALEASTAILSRYSDIEVVINLGVAGALDKRASIEEIYEIRTSYSMINNIVEFKSFTSKTSSKLDCITSSERTLSSEDANKLSNYANIVDRELWAIAKAAQNFNKEFKAFKLISDEPYKENKDSSICEIVKEKAEYFSDKLYKKYLQIETSEMAENKLLIEKYKELYFTVSQYRSYSTLLSQLLTKYESEKEILEKIPLNSIFAMELLPKQRTGILLESLRELLTPFNTKLNRELDSVLSPLHEANIKTILSKNLENDQFKITATINNEVELRKIHKALQSLDYQKYRSLMRGNLDV